MRFRPVSIYDPGDIQKERVHFQVLVDTDLAACILVDSWTDGTLSGGVATGNHTCYWFASQSVKAGQNVVVYTRVGTPSIETRPDGSIFHFMFRGLLMPIYTSSASAVIVMEIFEWSTLKNPQIASLTGAGEISNLAYLGELLKQSPKK